MGVSFSSAELERLTGVMRTLINPLRFESVDEWRLSANDQLKQLFGCSSAGFLLPGTSMSMLSAEHDQEALAGFPEVLPPNLSDGTPIWNRLIDCEVATLETAYGPSDIQRYYASPYYMEYASPNRARETMAACMAVSGFGPGGAASLHLWNDRTPGPRHFTDRHLAVLRLLYPAFHAGVRAQLRLDELRRDLHGLIDRLSVAVMVCDDDGRVVHETPAVAAVLAHEPEPANVRAAAHALATSREDIPVVEKEFTTPSARYCLSLIQDPGLVQGRKLTLVMIERMTRPCQRPEQLREQFGLTAAEARVALLLAEGLGNREIASRLAISEATSRRHTERVLAKLGVQSRARVGPRITAG